MKRIIKKVALICILPATLIVFSGCSAATTTSDSVKLKDEVSTLQIQVQKLNIDAEQAKNKSKELNLAGAEFVKVETDNAMFVVIVKQVEPYLDGVQVTLSIGNPMYATYNELKIKTKYGTKFDWTLADPSTRYDQWGKTLKEKSTDFSNQIKPGTWNTVKLILPTINPKDFGYMNVEITSDSVILLQP